MKQKEYIKLCKAIGLFTKDNDDCAWKQAMDILMSLKRGFILANNHIKKEG